MLCGGLEWTACITVQVGIGLLADACLGVGWRRMYVATSGVRHVIGTRLVISTQTYGDIANWLLSLWGEAQSLEKRCFVEPLRRPSKLWELEGG